MMSVPAAIIVLYFQHAAADVVDGEREIIEFPVHGPAAGERVTAPYAEITQRRGEPEIVRQVQRSTGAYGAEPHTAFYDMRAKGEAGFVPRRCEQGVTIGETDDVRIEERVHVHIYGINVIAKFQRSVERIVRVARNAVIGKIEPAAARRAPLEVAQESEGMFAETKIVLKINGSAKFPVGAAHLHAGVVDGEEHAGDDFKTFHPPGRRGFCMLRAQAGCGGQP